MAVDFHGGLLGPGDWAVMGKSGALRIAETVGGLPRSRALCGAVGTAFVVSSPPRAAAPVCERCAELARASTGSG